MSFIVILDNIRSAHNVGAIWRTAEAAGADQLILVGTTPAPTYVGDLRPPYVTDRAAKLIGKTALGAERLVPFEYYADIATAITQLQHNHYVVAALELTEGAINIFHYTPPANCALILGHESLGVSPATQAACDVVLEIPMAGRKESLNVSVAAGIAMYQLQAAKAQR
ncbi:TrmH family RNA methyltransferase [Candidatus Saccharibacteria bacterium]|nr:TrmH family RNA methyltransferase [Candidatus Saccharibacteria bacterium]